MRQQRAKHENPQGNRGGRHRKQPEVQRVPQAVGHDDADTDLQTDDLQLEPGDLGVAHPRDVFSGLPAGVAVPHPDEEPAGEKVVDAVGVPHDYPAGEHEEEAHQNAVSRPQKAPRREGSREEVAQHQEAGYHRALVHAYGDGGVEGDHPRVGRGGPAQHDAVGESKEGGCGGGKNITWKCSDKFKERLFPKALGFSGFL